MILTIGLIIVAALLLVVTWKYLSLKIEFEKKIVEEGRRIAESWKKEEIEKEVDLLLKQKEKSIREDAHVRSSSVLVGKLSEQFAPVIKFDKVGLNPRDARFIGTPIDYVVFNGISEGELKEISFVEIKSGKSKLTKEEKQIKDAVEKKKVKWVEINLDGGSSDKQQKH